MDAHTLSSCCDDFDQSRSLLPLPFPKHYHLASLVDGVRIGDKLFDEMPMRDLLAAVRGGRCHAMESAPLPDWVDKAAIVRGQALHIRRMLSFLISLTGGLLHGFVIGRFSEVLVMAGYTSDDWTTFVRYRDTSSAIYKWMAYDLLDCTSKAFKSVVQVRAMHALARRSVRAKWDVIAREQGGLDGVGLPLSQYDLSLVQMAFCAMTLDVLQRECQVPLTLQERQDYVHLWRYIGHLLGIESKYNIANDVKTAARCFDEFLSAVPPLSRHPRPACVQLVQSSVRAFGTYTLASYEFFTSLLYGLVREDLPLSVEWCQIKPPPNVYCKFIVNGVAEPTWLLPSFLWHFLFATFIYLQCNFPTIMTMAERCFGKVPNRFKA